MRAVTGWLLPVPKWQKVVTASASRRTTRLILAWVLYSKKPKTTWTPARSISRAQRRLASSSKRALISTRAVTFLPFSAASIRAATIGLSFEVR